MPRTTRNPLAGVFGKYAVPATITHVEPVTPTMRRIRLETDQPIAFPYTPGQHIRIQLKDPLSMSGILRPSETLRTYTIWDLSPERRTLELRVHLYGGDGIGLRWAHEARPGEAVTFWWPQGDFFTREAAYHVFIGEETAGAAFGPMIRALGASAEVYGILESEASEHDLPMPGTRPLRRVHRHGAPAASSRVLLAAVAELDLPGNAGAAYVAGEARTCQLVRDFLVRERNWPRTSITVKPFWTPGKRGLH
ncbi:siderophore-interacting protein [Streptosporangium roseum]|uniref:Siderophore-interacting protein-like protein n=1 Tax=Streptosporangium roseum (strain ATCC 12428 / DSM 43021 / JCM 3005 / KCTC 9067 / NCIMB 10171 / NRRL 2505 / NI 9100) TaxID=479432 RepID=D2BFF0_STRRD|nr:siderophore-interacting protein [Streptosporangium roseum]ACZ88308.1 Siderophore-interacting protein-like protein [Streptosporangium roseum DSM 43021]